MKAGPNNLVEVADDCAPLASCWLDRIYRLQLHLGLLSLIRQVSWYRRWPLLDHFIGLWLVSAYRSFSLLIYFGNTFYGSLALRRKNFEAKRACSAGTMGDARKGPKNLQNHSLNNLALTALFSAFCLKLSRSIPLSILYTTETLDKTNSAPSVFEQRPNTTTTWYGSQACKTSRESRFLLLH